LAHPDRRVLGLAVLLRLASEGLLVEVLTAPPGDGPVALARALGVRTEPDWPAGAGASGAPVVPSPTTARLSELAPTFPASWPRATVALALHVEAARLLGPSADASAVRYAMASALLSPRVGSRSAPTRGEPATTRAPSPGDPLASEAVPPVDEERGDVWTTR